MRNEIKMRVIVSDPLAGVAMLVQDGKDKLLPPLTSSAAAFVFEFPITVDLSSGSPNFLGRFAQGPKDARFVYVNSGTYAGEHHICWGRRAKLSLMTITREQVEKVIQGKDLLLETTMPGVGQDGGPTCANVKGIVWRVAKR